MSLLDQASLVLVPSAIKTGEVLVQKPLPTKFSDETGNYDGNDPTTNANLTFTRNSNATRVNADGLVEKVRTNLLLQSNQFDTTWVAVSASVTSGQAGYDGSNNAWLLTKSNSSGRVNQTISTLSSASNTLSVYVKANASTWCAIEYSGSYRYLNLSTGAVGAGLGGYTVDSIGNGWYRFSISSSTASSVFRIYPAEENDIAATSGSIFIQNAQAEVSDFGPTPYIPTTTSARSTFAGITVDGTSVPNVPRLDYSGGGCSRLILEPQRTNLALYSEQFDNAAWTKLASTITPNVGVSPSGYQDADNWAGTNANLFRGGTTGVEYTISIYAKSNGQNKDKFKLRLGNDVSAEFTATSEWQRFTFTGTPATPVFGLTTSAAPNNEVDILVWGAQIEQASYASSYIGPTLGASVTRLADAASKTGISSLIGQTEGTLFVEANLSDTTNDVFRGIAELNDGTTANRITLFRNTNGTLRLFVRQSSTTQADISYGTLVTGSVKIAVAYANNDISFYVNGVQVGTDTSATIPACSDFDLGIQENNTDRILGNSISQALLFKTRLTNAQLAELTAL